MALTPGTRLGPYAILDKLGEGGMGEVYRASDARLDREVAIKVLPGSVADDPDRLARFEREAKAVAALSHPNILAIFDVGVERPAATEPGSASAPVVAYAVTELLEGETLRARLSEGPLTMRKTVEYAGQIARGLASAHEKNLVHRDLKPENIFLLRDGQVKILDFGLAKAAVAGDSGDASGADDATRLGQVTDPGTVLGTFGYMAPEQVRGQSADGRSDLFSLGAVLHEMLSGERAFTGATPADTMTAILKEDPPEIVGSRASVSPALDRIIRHCLEKNPAERFQSARDVAFALEALSGSTTSSGAPPISETDSAPGIAATRRPSGALVAAAAVVLALGGAMGYVMRGPADGAGTPVAEVTYQPVTFDEGFVFAGRFGPDGRAIVFSADWEGQRRDIFMTSVDSPESRPLGFAGADLLALSRSSELAVLDGSTLVAGSLYNRRGILSLASLTGGALRPELENVSFADFAPNDEMAIVRRIATGAALEYPVGDVLEREFEIVTPRISPDGRHVAAFRFGPRGANMTVRIYARAGDMVAESGPLTDWWSLAWTPDNEVWFAGTEAAGSQTAVFGLDLAGHQRLIYRAPGSLTVHDISAQGDLLASFDQYRTRVELVDAGGDLAPLDLSWKEDARPVGLADDHTVLFNQSGDSGGPSGGVFVWRPGATQPVRISDGTAVGFSPDGGTALISRAGEWFAAPTGIGRPAALDLGALGAVTWAGWHPDGRIILSGTTPDGTPQVYAVAPTGGAPVALLPEGVEIVGGRLISPDGTRLVGVDPQGDFVVCILTSTACQVIPGLLENDEVAGWSADNATIFVFQLSPIPATVDRVDVNSGRRTAWRTVEPLQAAVSGLRTLHAGPDGTIAYSYSRARTQLYVIRGLR